MKVTHLCERFAPLVGGMELAVNNLARHQLAMGLDVEVVTMAAPEAKEGSRPTLPPVREVGHVPLGAYHPPAPDPVVASGLRKLGVGDADVVHAHGLMGLSFLALKAAHLVNAPVVWTMHDYGLVCPKRTLLYSDGSLCEASGPVRCSRCASTQYGALRAVGCTIGLSASRRLLREVDHWIAVSTPVADAHAFEPTSVIPPGVIPASEFEDVPAPAFLPSEPFMIYVGRMGEAKGTDVLLKAYEALGPSRPALLMIVAGEVPETMPVVQGCVVVQNVSPAEVRASLRRAMFAVLPSVWPEPCSMAVVEAMSAGIPVVATSVGGNPSILQDGGLLVPPGDPAALAAAMRRIIDDAPFAKECAARLPRLAEAHSIGHVAKQVLDVYEDVAGDRGGRPRTLTRA